MHEPTPETSISTMSIRVRGILWHRVGTTWHKAERQIEWLMAVGAILLGVVTITAIGRETGVAPLLTGTIWAVLPVPCYILLVLWLDRNEPEPPWALVGVFFWGALIATFLSLVITNYGQSLAEVWLGGRAAEIYAKCVSAPIVEEGSKAVAILLIIAVKREEFDGVVDGMVYASLVGLGFAMTENILYYAHAVKQGETLPVFIARGIFMPYAHPLFTCLTGIGIGVAANASGKVRRVVIVLMGLTLAMGLHAFWNASVLRSQNSGGSPFFTYLTVMVPVFLLAVINSAVALHNERRVLSTYLLIEVEAGLLSADEHREICTFIGRQRAAARALRVGGVRQLRLQMEINGAAGHLAFYRNRISRQRTVDGPNCEHEAIYVERLMKLRMRARSQADRKPILTR